MRCRQHVLRSPRGEVTSLVDLTGCGLRVEFSLDADPRGVAELIYPSRPRMLTLPAARIVLATEPVHMRRGHDGPCAIVQSGRLDPVCRSPPRGVAYDFPLRGGGCERHGSRFSAQISQPRQVRANWAAEMQPQRIPKWLNDERQDRLRDVVARYASGPASNGFRMAARHLLRLRACNSDSAFYAGSV